MISLPYYFGSSWGRAAWSRNRERSSILVALRYRLLEVGEMNAVRVLVVADSAAFVWGLRATLETDSGFLVAGVANNGVEALTLAEALQPDLAIVDLRIAPQPGAAGDYRHGLQTIEKLKIAVPGLRVLAMTFSPEARWPVEAVRAGASGFVSKDALREDMFQFWHNSYRIAEQDPTILLQQI